MKKSIVAFLVFACATYFLAGCDKISLPGKKKVAPPEKTQVAPVVKGTVIARINNAPLTLEDLNQEVEAFNSMVPPERPEAKITTREKKLDYLKNELVRRMLLYQTASDRGLDRKEAVQKALEKTKQDLLVVELVKEEANKVEVSSAEVEDYYNRYKEQLKEPEERQIREIMVNSEAEAKDILIQLLQGADFATLAKDKSKGPTAASAGDLGFLQKGKKPAQFDAVAFSDTLEAGQYSNVFKGPDGYYIIKMEAKRGGKQRSLSEMWDDIKRGLLFLKQQQRVEDLIGKLSQEAKIEIYEGEVK